MSVILWFVAYGWLILAGLMHFIIDVVSQYLRGARVPGPETTLYFGLNTAYALGQLLYGLSGLIIALKAPEILGHWPLVVLGLAAAAGWLGISFIFLKYWEPKLMTLIFVLLVIAAVFAS